MKKTRTTYKLTAVGNSSPSPVYPVQISRERNASEAEAELVAKFSSCSPASPYQTWSQEKKSDTSGTGREQQHSTQHSIRHGQRDNETTTTTAYYTTLDAVEGGLVAKLGSYSPASPHQRWFA